MLQDCTLIESSDKTRVFPVYTEKIRVWSADFTSVQYQHRRIFFWRNVLHLLERQVKEDSKGFYAWHSIIIHILWSRDKSCINWHFNAIFSNLDGSMNWCCTSKWGLKTERLQNVSRFEMLGYCWTCSLSVTLVWIRDICIYECIGT